jgi:hypothetical protein
MDASQQQHLLLSAATTPAGSAYSSPSASYTLSSGSIIKALALKKLLKKSEPPRAHTVIKSRTIFPSTAPKTKVDYSHVSCMVLAPENPIPIKQSTFEEEDAEVANDLPAIPYRKRDKYSNPFYSTWMPHVVVLVHFVVLVHDHITVLVHFKSRGLETEDTKPKLVCMNFTDYNEAIASLPALMPISTT